MGKIEGLKGQNGPKYGVLVARVQHEDADPVESDLRPHMVTAESPTDAVRRACEAAVRQGMGLTDTSAVPDLDVHVTSLDGWSPRFGWNARITWRASGKLLCYAAGTGAEVRS